MGKMLAVRASAQHHLIKKRERLAAHQRPRTAKLST